MSEAKIDHIGIAVKSVEDALKIYQKGLGLSVKGIESLPKRKLNVCFIHVGESKIELLEPTSEESTVHKFISTKGEGLHHIAINVENIEETMLKLKETGCRFLSEKPEEGAGGTKIIFLHPKTTFGVLIELVEGHH